MQMKTQHTRKTSRSSASKKALLAGSAASLAVMLAMPMTAQAQVVIDITTDQTTPLENPGDNAETIINIDSGVTWTISDNGTNDGRPANSNIELENATDNVTINNAGTLINNDETDEETVIFFDNSEDNLTVVNTGVMQGVDGVLYLEGDGFNLTNSGTIEGTGAADEGVIYFDREADSTPNFITNTGLITGVGGPTIGVDASRDILVLTIDNQSGGVISNTDVNDSDSDAININGDPGNESSTERGCLEADANINPGAETSDFDPTTFTGTNVRCQHNLTITNAGTISAARDTTSNAAIQIESDAVVTGSITNAASGVITGANTGIKVSGAHGDHDLTITNEGEITGTSNAGVVITGAGVNLANSATGTITGGDVGVLVESSVIDIRIGPFSDDDVADGNADPLDITGVAVAAVDNTFVNAGTISGTRASFDASGAGEGITFEQQGGALTGDFLGTTAFDDTLSFTTADFTLTHDVLQSVDVDVASGVDLDVDGVRTIDGNFEVLSGGTVSFDLGAAPANQDQLLVSGDVFLRSGSTVQVVDTGAVTALDQSFTLIDLDGTLLNNADLDATVADNSFLLDFDMTTDAMGNLVVTSEAAIVTPPPVTDITVTNGDTVTSYDDGDLIEVVTDDVVDITEDGTSTVASGDIILVDGGAGNVIINNAGTLTDNDNDDEDTAIFIDSNEEATIVNNLATGQIIGSDGGVYFEGNNSVLFNDGLITGIGDQNEGAVFVDRDAENITINNNATGVIESTAGGAAVGIDLDVDGANNTVNITNVGTIRALGDVNGDSDGINFNGDPGSLSGSTVADGQRNCGGNPSDNGPTVLLGICSFDGTITNSGTISTTRESSSNAGIRFEDDATFAGVINNSGTIEGVSNGIRFEGASSETIGEEVVTPGGATTSGTAFTTTEIVADVFNAELVVAALPTGVINNSGLINATGADSAYGIRHGGRGVEINNAAAGVISGASAGIYLDTDSADIVLSNAGEISSTAGSGLRLAGTGHSLTSSGIISGATASVDGSLMAEAFSFTQSGGTLTGDFLGSTGFTDTLAFTSSDFTLTHDVLQDVNVSVDSGVDLTVDGARTIDGDLTSDGTLSFDLAAADSLDVSGDVTLNDGSVIAVTDSGAITSENQTFTLITVGGDLTNNATLDATVDDDSFLLDFQAVEDANGNLVVQTSATAFVPDQLFAGAGSANLSAYGESVLAAFAAGELNNQDIFSLLSALETQEDFEAAVADLLPDLTSSSSYEVYQLIGTLSNLIGDRMVTSSNTSASLYGEGFSGFTSNSLFGSDTSNSESTGAWVRGSYRAAEHDNASGSAISDGYNADSFAFTAGYDVNVMDNVIVGLSGTYSQIEVDQERAAANSSDIDVFQLSAYGAAQSGQVFINGQIGYTTGSVSAERTALGTNITGDYDLDGYNLQAQVGVDFELSNGGYIAPVVGVQYATVDADAFTENGGLNQTINAEDSELFEAKIGVIAGKGMSTDAGNLDIFGRAAYVVDAGDSGNNLNVAFTNQSTNLTTLDVDDERFELGAGAKWDYGTTLSLAATIDGEFADSYNAVGGSLRAKYRF